MKQTTRYDVSIKQTQTGNWEPFFSPSKDGEWVLAKDHEAALSLLPPPTDVPARVAKCMACNDTGQVDTDAGKGSTACLACAPSPSPDAVGVLMWLDERDVKFDDTIMFGKGYCFDGWNCFREEADTAIGRFAVWPEHQSWSIYGGFEFWMQRGFASKAEAQNEVERMHIAALSEKPTDPAHGKPAGGGVTG